MDWTFIFVGVLSAFAFLFKAVYLASLALAGLTLLVEWWPNRRIASHWQTPLRRGLWLAVSLVALTWLPLLANWLGPWAWQLGHLFPVILWLNLYLKRRVLFRASLPSAR